jgi:hypothetical protein
METEPSSNFASCGGFTWYAVPPSSKHLGMYFWQLPLSLKKNWVDQEVSPYLDWFQNIFSHYY